MRWVEMKCKCEVWSVGCEECNVKCEESVCIVPGSRAGHALGQQHCNSFAQSTHAPAWLAHGACKFYRWERSYIYIYIFKATSAPPRAGTTGIDTVCIYIYIETMHLDNPNLVHFSFANMGMCTFINIQKKICHWPQFKEFLHYLKYSFVGEIRSFTDLYLEKATYLLTDSGNQIPALNGGF